MTSPKERPPVQRHSELEQPLVDVEEQLVALSLGLRQQDTAAIDRAATALHVALAAAVDHFARAARAGSIPPGLRRRLAVASGQVAAQREALARATASLDRAIDALLPRPATAGVYSAAGAGVRAASTPGSLLA
jgi:ABC-type transporter Mla subunit MlaD